MFCNIHLPYRLIFQVAFHFHLIITQLHVKLEIVSYAKILIWHNGFATELAEYKLSFSIWQK